MAIIHHPPSCTCPLGPSRPDFSVQRSSPPPPPPTNQLAIPEYRPPPPGNTVVGQHQFAPIRKNYSRRNAWGNVSYADLITKAIESAPDKRLTLSQIYEWMVHNVPYFRDKGGSNSSSGWKNSIRHTLTLHGRFERIQNEGSGRSSWWVINHHAPRNGKSMRRRSSSGHSTHGTAQRSNDGTRKSGNASELI